MPEPSSLDRVQSLLIDGYMRRQRGEVAPLEDLCRKHPEPADELRRRAAD